MPVFTEGLTNKEERLRHLMEVDHVYLKLGISVQDLADMIESKPRDLPQILQKTYSCGFKELINTFRINYAIEKIESFYLDKYTLESLAQLSGFTSRITFFNVFKKEKGISPSEYWNKIKEKE